MNTIQQLVDLYGGSRKLSEDLGGSPAPPAISHWYHKGMPEHYWHLFVEKGLASVEELHFLNLLARNQKTDLNAVEQSYTYLYDGSLYPSYFTDLSKKPKKEKEDG